MKMVSSNWVPDCGEGEGPELLTRPLENEHGGYHPFMDEFLVNLCTTILGLYSPGRYDIHIYIYMVGGFNPSERSWSSSVGMMTFPIYGKS